MKIGITGGHGFIGGHAQQHYEDCVVWDVKNKKNIFDLSSEDVDGVDKIIHLAAWLKPRESLFHAQEYWENNVNGLNYLLSLWDGPLLFASSASIYEPLNPYACTKIVGETLLKDRPQTQIARFFNIFGEEDKKSVVYFFIKAAINNKPIKIFGNGEQIREFTYVKDLVSRWELGSGTYNMGGVPITILELAEKILSLTNSNSTIEFLPKKDGDPFISVAGETGIKTVKSTLDLDEGLKKTIEWIEKNNNEDYV